MNTLHGSRVDSHRIRVLCAATEAGSGKALLPVLRSLSNCGVAVSGFLPRHTLAFRCAERIVPEADLEPVADGLQAPVVLDARAPDLILVGTTGGDSLERALTVEAGRRGISTLAVVDERYGFRRRFNDEGNGLRYLTDIVTLMDEACRLEAIAEGLPPERLAVTGSPILSYLVHELSARRASVQRSHAGRKQITFLSETIARDNGSSLSRPGRLGTYLGFTEDTVRRDIIAVLQGMNYPTVLFERLHPSDVNRSGEERIDRDLLFRREVEGDLWTRLAHSDAVIGIRSFALLEAGLLGCSVASYQPGLIGKDHCAAARFGVADRLVDREGLKIWFARCLGSSARFRMPPVDLPFIRQNAADAVSALVLDLCGRQETSCSTDRGEH